MDAGKPEAAKPSMSASPKKRKRKTAELGSDSETATEEAPAKAEAASPAKKKKAVLKYKAPTKKVTFFRGPKAPSRPFFCFIVPSCAGH